MDMQYILDYIIQLKSFLKKQIETKELPDDEAQQETRPLTDAEMCDLLNSLCYGNMGYGTSQYIWQADINGYVAELTKGTKAVNLPAKAQKHATCSFVNIKSSIQGILYLLERERLLNSGITDTARLHKESASYAQSEYKHFSKFIRDEEIKKLINGLKNALDKSLQQSNPEVTFYTQLLIHAITAHHGSKTESSPAKKANELARIQMIVKALDQYPEVIKEIISTLGESYTTLLQPVEASVVMHVAPVSLSQSSTETTSTPVPSSPSVGKPKK